MLYSRQEGVQEKRGTEGGQHSGVAQVVTVCPELLRMSS